MAAEYWTSDQVAIWVEGIGGVHASTIGSLFRSLNVDGAALFALTPTAVDTLFARTHLGANVSATELDGCKYRLLWQLEALRRARLAELERSIALVQGRKPALSASSSSTTTTPPSAAGMMNGTSSSRTAWSEVPAIGAPAAVTAATQPPVMSRRPSIESTTSTGSSSSSIKRRPDSASSASSSAAGTATPRQQTSSASSSQRTPASANRRRSMSPTRAPSASRSNDITSPPSSATKPAKRASPTTPSTSSAASSQTHRRTSSSSSQPSSSSTPRPGRRGSVDSTASSTPLPAATATTASGSNGKQTNNNRARSRSRGRARSTSPKAHTNTRSHSKGRQTAQPSAATQSTPVAAAAPTVIGAPALARTSSLPTTTTSVNNNNNGSQGSLRRNGQTTTTAKPPPIPPRPPLSSSVTSTPPPRASSSQSSSSFVPSTAPAGTRASSRSFSSFSPTSSNPLSVSIPSAPSTPASQNSGAGRERGQSFDSTSSHAPGTPTMSIILTPPLTKQDNNGILFLQDEQVAGVAKRRLESLTPWFGVELSEETGGVRVKGCKPGSPAEEVGLQPGDLITTLAARAVSTRIQFVTITQQLRVGDRVEMFVTRSGVNDIVFNVQVGSKDVSLSALRQLVLLAEGGMRTTELTSPQRHLLEKTGKFWADDYDRMMETRTTAVLPPNGGLANIVDDEDDDERFTPEQLAQRNKAKVAEIARAKQLHAEAREAERREEEEEMRARLLAQKFGGTHAVNGNGYHHHHDEDKDEHYTATQVLHDDTDPASSHEAEYKPSSSTSSQLSSEQKYGTPTAAQAHAQHQQQHARHIRSGSGKFNLSTQLARVHQQMDDAEMDADTIHQFVDHLKARWALLDEHNEGHVTRHGLKLAVWHNQPDPDQRSLPMPDVLDQELQGIIDEISRGTGNQDSFGFWQFAQYACDDFFADNSDFHTHFPSFRLSPN